MWIYGSSLKFLRADLSQQLKRKSRKSSSTSSEEENRPSEDKRSKFDLSEEDCEVYEVHSVLEMSKLDNVPKKLMKTKFDSLGGYVKNADAKVNALTTKVKTLQQQQQQMQWRARQRIGVPQRKINLAFYGIEEDPEGSEDTWQVLVVLSLGRLTGWTFFLGFVYKPTFTS